MNAAAEAPRLQEALFNPIIYDFVAKTHSCHLRSCRKKKRLRSFLRKRKKKKKRWMYGTPSSEEMAVDTHVAR